MFNDFIVCILIKTHIAFCIVRKKMLSPWNISVKTEQMLMPQILPFKMIIYLIWKLQNNETDKSGLMRFITCVFN